MNVNIVIKKEWTYGWPFYYATALQRMPNVNAVYIDNKNYLIPFSKWFQDYIYNPLYVRSKVTDCITHFLDPYHGHYIYYMNNQKIVITCHDIYHTVVNDYNGLKKKFYDLSIKGMLKAYRIIADSEHTKKDLVKYLSCPEEKIRVIPLGIDPGKFKPMAMSRNSVRKIILHVGHGGNEERKNISGLIKAFYELKKKIPDVKMIQIGADKGIFENLIQQLQLQKDMEFQGIITEKKLREFYNLADVFVFPSFYEGFGLPPLEAMACGCPVITSNAASLPEVVDNAGIMVDPLNIDGLAEAIYNVLTNDGLREDMIKKGLERAKMFTWERTARETYKVYEEVWNEK
jgi:glycosyltransferase involved in cell wall biosynthesis